MFWLWLGVVWHRVWYRYGASRTNLWHVAPPPPHNYDIPTVHSLQAAPECIILIFCALQGLLPLGAEPPIRQLRKVAWLCTVCSTITHYAPDMLGMPDELRMCVVRTKVMLTLNKCIKCLTHIKHHNVHYVDFVNTISTHSTYQSCHMSSTLFTTYNTNTIV